MLKAVLTAERTVLCSLTHLIAREPYPMALNARDCGTFS